MTRLLLFVCATACMGERVETLEREVKTLKQRVGELEEASEAQVKADKKRRCVEIFETLVPTRSSWKRCIAREAEYAWEFGLSTAAIQGCSKKQLPYMQEAKALECVYKDATKPLHGLFVQEYFEAGRTTVDLADHL